MTPVGPGQRPVDGRRHRCRSRARGRSRSRAGATRTATWRHNAEIKIPAGIDIDLMFAEGAAFFDRAAAGVPPAVRADRATLGDAAHALANGALPPEARLAAGISPQVRCRPRRYPVARADHLLGDLSGVGRPDPRAVRQLVRVLPAVGGSDRTTRRPGSGRPGPSGPRPSGSRRSRGWASTSSTCRRSTRSATRSARARTTRSTRSRATRVRRGRSGRRRAATTRSTRSSAPSRTSSTSSARPARSAWRSRIDLALQASPDHPWVKEHPKWFSSPRRRLDRVRREPAEEVPGHLPDQLRQRSRGHLRRGAADREALDLVRRDRVPGRQPAHQAGELLGVPARRDPQDRPGRGVPVRGVHPAGR